MPHPEPPLLDELDARAASLPTLLAASSELVSEGIRDAKERAPSLFSAVPLVWDVVGVGASALPAELLVHVLCSAGVAARHVPLSTFACERSTAASRANGPHPSAPRGLVLFSQGLSPNARLALSSLLDATPAFVVTAVPAAEESTAARRIAGLPPSVAVLRHLPEREPGALLRVQGPLCAADAALQLAEALLAERGLPAPAPDRRRALDGLTATQPEAAVEAPVLTWLTLDVPVLAARAASWFWQEGLHEPAAPALDLLAFAHGAFQATWERSGVHVVLARRTAEPGDLVERLRAMLPEHQRLMVLEVNSSEGLAPLLLSARVTRLALAEIRARGLDPARWPGQGKDEPLYRLGE